MLPTPWATEFFANFFFITFPFFCHAPTGQGEDDADSSKMFSKVFKIVLGVLVPIFALLGLLLFWKVWRSRKTWRSTMPKETPVAEKMEIDIEGGDSVRELGTDLGDKAMKHSLTDSVRSHEIVPSFLMLCDVAFKVWHCLIWRDGLEV